MDIVLPRYGAALLLAVTIMSCDGPTQTNGGIDVGLVTDTTANADVGFSDPGQNETDLGRADTPSSDATDPIDAVTDQQSDSDDVSTLDIADEVDEDLASDPDTGPPCPPQPPVWINEIVSANFAGIEDNRGDTPDWIELRNASDDAINLDGWGLSDDPDQPFKWRLPNLTLSPDEYLLIFASGQEQTDGVASWDTVRDWGDDWRYMAVATEIDSGWHQLEFDDTDWALGPSGFGYGDEVDATSLDANTIHVRATFELTEDQHADLMAAVLHVDYDDGFVAYLNGHEIARGAMGAAGTPVAPGANAVDSHEAGLYRGWPPEAFPVETIETVLVGENVIALEVHNIHPSSSDLTLIPFFSVGFSTARDGVPSDHLDLEVSQLHASFALSADGEDLLLTEPGGCRVDELSYGPLRGDESAGRTTDGEALVVFMEPTPGEANTTESFSGFAPTPVFTPSPGFHGSETVVELTADHPAATIYYTLDGSEPEPDGLPYDAPIPIAGTDATVIRARAFVADRWPSRVATGTFFTRDRAELGVLSLTMEPANLWDNETGIYVLGDEYQRGMPFHGANFWEDWERPIHAAFWEPDGSPGFSLDCGVTIHGGWSRAHAQRSLRLIMRAAYGTSRLDYAVFPDLGIDEFKRLILRNSGNDAHVCSFFGCSWGVHLRDATMHAIASATDLDILAYRPVHTYLNGEYWGIYNIRERHDRFYTDSHHGEEDIDLLESSGFNASEGTSDHYQGMLDFIRTSDLTDSDVYAELQTMMDTDNFATYQSLQIFFANTDWPGNNIKFWRPREESGRWRWMLYDTDFGLGLGNRQASHNTMAFALQQNGPNWPNPPWATELLRALVVNPDFRRDFINRYADYLNTFLATEQTQAVLGTLASDIEAAMVEHHERWGVYSVGDTHHEITDGAWDDQIARIETWLQERPGFAREHISSSFGLAGLYTLSLEVSPPGSGSFRLTAVDVEGPFEGVYFRGVPVTVIAVPKLGRSFVGWSDSELGTEAEIVVDPEGNLSLTANFE